MLCGYEERWVLFRVSLIRKMPEGHCADDWTLLRAIFSTSGIELTAIHGIFDNYWNRVPLPSELKLDPAISEVKTIHVASSLEVEDCDE